MASDKRVLLIIGGGIAAFKTPELVRGLRRHGFRVRCLLTAAGAQFVSPLTLASVSGDHVYENLFDLTDEADMGHIQLSRDADFILVAPATADLIAKMAQGIAGDLASTTLLATDKPVAIAPAMNVRMWHHPATQRNLEQIRADGIHIFGPDQGDMACGEFGLGRMREPDAIIADLLTCMPDHAQHGRLAGRHAVVTAGPTHEPIDPVRYLANRSSGKQGYAIAEALVAAGARVTLISGPTALKPPANLTFIGVETALEMQTALNAHLPADIAIMTAAIADWRPEAASDQKMKKTGHDTAMAINLIANPDILAELCRGPQKPELVIGFAAETENLEAHAQEKFSRKKCDWLVANNVAPEGGVMGGDYNTVTVFTRAGTESWPHQSKADVARLLVDRICDTLTATVSNGGAPVSTKLRNQAADPIPSQKPSQKSNRKTSKPKGTAS